MHRIVAVDIETASETRPDFERDEILCVGLSWEPGSAVVIPWSVVTGHRKVHTLLRRLLMHPDIDIIGHNLKFDLKFLRRYGIESRYTRDTMIAHYLLDERRGTHSLALVAPRYVGLDTREHELQPFLPSRATPFSKVPAGILYRYNARDADCERRLDDVLQRRLVGASFRQLYYDLIMPAARSVLESEMRGITVDRKHLKALRTEIKEKIRDAERKLSQGGKYNLNSPKQLAHLLYDKERIPTIEGRTTRRAVLEKMGHPFAKELLEYRNAQKLEGTYLHKLWEMSKGIGHLVYPEYHFHSTVTGRLSETRVGLMTMPRHSRYRNIFIARKGCTFITIDYKASEVRWVAVYSQDGDLLRIVNSGRDIHTEVAQGMFQHTAKSWAKLSDDDQKQLRIYSKAVVFGLLYGRGTASLAIQLKISLEKAREYMDRFFAQFPGVRLWMRTTGELAIRARELTTVFGRKRRWGYIPDDNRHQVARQAINFLPSSSSSDMCLSSYVTCMSAIPGVVNAPIFLHDGFVLEAKEDAAEEAAKQAVDICEHVEEGVGARFGFSTNGVRFTVDCALGHRWGTPEQKLS